MPEHELLIAGFNFWELAYMILCRTVWHVEDLEVFEAHLDLPAL